MRSARELFSADIFAGMTSAHLSHCPDLKDATTLARAERVELMRCSDNLTDVSALGGVHILRLHHCPRLTNVSALGSVRVLELAQCPKRTDVSLLGGVHHLTLVACGGGTDVPALGHVYHLVLRRCPGVDDVWALGGVRVLELSLRRATPSPLRTTRYRTPGLRTQSFHFWIRLQKCHPL